MVTAARTRQITPLTASAALPSPDLPSPDLPSPDLPAASQRESHSTSAGIAASAQFAFASLRNAWIMITAITGADRHSSRMPASSSRFAPRIPNIRAKLTGPAVANCAARKPRLFSGA